MLNHLSVIDLTTFKLTTRTSISVTASVFAVACRMPLASDWSVDWDVIRDWPVRHEERCGGCRPRHPGGRLYVEVLQAEAGS